jgi:hypothetical protein
MREILGRYGWLDQDIVRLEAGLKLDINGAGMRGILPTCARFRATSMRTPAMLLGER